MGKASSPISVIGGGFAAGAKPANSRPGATRKDLIPRILICPGHGRVKANGLTHRATMAK